MANTTKQSPLSNDPNNVANNSKEAGNAGQVVPSSTSDTGNGDQEVAKYDANCYSAGELSCNSAQNAKTSGKPNLRPQRLALVWKRVWLLYSQRARTILRWRLFMLL